MSKLKEGYIRYSNEEQRKAAIMQAESLGYKEWEKNRKYQKPSDNCIVFRGIDGEWNDELCTEITEADFYEIPLDAKEYDKAETNCEGCMGPCGECEVEFTKKVKEAFKYPTEGNPLLPPNWVWCDGYTYNSEKYHEKKYDDGAIILKPKTKVKLGLITYFDNKHNDFRATALMPISVVKDYEKSLKENDQKILIEVIEREYEI